jgi:ATP-dependent Clp protease protease subunit
MEAWWERLAGPVAEKMGISLEEFIDKMYSNTVTGDWTEFADDAQKIKWVDHVVKTVEETALLTSPDAAKESTGSGTAYGSESIRPENAIPRLNPKDMLYLYNPDGYYKPAGK